MAMVSMNPVVSHWAMSAETEKSDMIAGSATDRIVSLRIIAIAETTRIASTMFTRFGSRPVGASWAASWWAGVGAEPVAGPSEVAPGREVGASAVVMRCLSSSGDHWARARLVERGHAVPSGTPHGGGDVRYTPTTAQWGTGRCGVPRRVLSDGHRAASTGVRASPCQKRTAAR